MSHHLSTSGGIQERIVAPIPRRPRAKLGDVRPTSKPTTPVAILHPPPRGLDHVLSGGLTAAGTIQERMRWPTRTGTEVMRTVAARVNLTPSHYAMLGVPRDFTEAQLRKQYRLLAMRYHPDAADRNGIDPQEALERFTALQTAYSVLSDPERRRRYDMQERLQHRREWRRAWDVLVPAGLPPGSPLLVPLPAATDDDEVGRKLRLSAEMDAKEQAREAQLLELMGRGVSAQEAAQYCDGVTAVDELAALIASDAAALEAGEEASIEEPQAPSSHHARGGSSFCIVS
eukprot:jgi/Chrpa1/10286/Chrysochromulina_OHIO_Genome00002588-RA